MKDGTPFPVALSAALKKITRKAGGTVSQENQWRQTEKYAGRPLVAAWATAPYLHNNSVPTLYHLLLPADKRPRKFYLGHRQYDTAKLGYVVRVEGETPPGQYSVLFDTSKPGNGNQGHSGPEYGTDLGDDEREALLEYLKSVR